jgi:hypothetical protein
VHRWILLSRRKSERGATDGLALEIKEPMNRSLPSLLAGALLVLILGLYMITYQVRFTEVAIIKTFGKAAAPDAATKTSGDVITEPGLYK